MAAVAAPLEKGEILAPPVGGRTRVAVLGGVDQDPRRIVDRIEQEPNRRVQALAFDLEAPEIVALTSGELGHHDQRGDRLALVPECPRPACGLEGQAAVWSHVLERAAIGGDAEAEGGIVGSERAPGHDRARCEIGVVVAGGELLRALGRETVARALDEPGEPGLDAPAPVRGHLRRVANQRPGDDGRQQEAIDRVVGGRIGRRRIEQGLAAGPAVERIDQRLPCRRVLGPEACGAGPHHEPGDRIEPGIGRMSVTWADRAGRRPAPQPQIFCGTEGLGAGGDDRPAPLDRVDQDNARPTHEPRRLRGLRPRRAHPVGTTREQEAEQEEEGHDPCARATGHKAARG